MSPVLGANIRLARLFHGLSLSDLGERLGRSKQFLSRVETGVEPVSDALEIALVDELGVLPEFLREVEAMPLTEEQCHFRKQLTTKVTLRQYARARGEMLKRLVGVLDAHLELPPYKIAEADPTSDEAIERGSERCRVEWGLGWGPISNITRVAENAGAVVMRVAGMAAEIDAVSFATARPVIALNAVGRSACRARFGVAHELGHFALHTGGVDRRPADRDPGEPVRERTVAAQDVVPGGEPHRAAPLAAELGRHERAQAAMGRVQGSDPVPGWSARRVHAGSAARRLRPPEAPRRGP
jgi:transcriptional regulator with XRE-family HTH domain